MTNATSPRGGTLLLVLLASCGAPNAVPDDPRWLNFAAAKGPGRGKHVVLIALTGYGQEADRQTALQAGFNHHLVKPARLVQLQEILAIVSEQMT